MERTKWHLAGGLSGEQLGKIRDDAVELLEKCGAGIESEEILDELSRHDGLTVEGGRVCYSADLVEKFFEWAREDNAEYMLNDPSRDEPVLRPAFLCMRVWDREAGKARPATVRDLERATRLLDSYGCEGIPPVHPRDVEDRLRQVVTTKAALENSRAIGSHIPASSAAETEMICRMCEAAGRPGPHVALQVAHSPMRLDAPMLSMILEMARAGRRPDGVAVGGGAMPLAGAAAPLLMPGFLAQGLAEALSAYGTAKLLNENVRGYCSVFPGTFDMRYSQMSMAAPEAVIYWLAIREMLEHFLGRTVGADLSCMAKTYDAQAGAEKMAAVLTGALSGATTFSNVGMTPMDEVFHFDGAVVDVEIVRYALRAARGLAWEGTPTLEIVEEGREAGTFLMHETTMKFRDELWDPVIFTRESLNKWISEGSPELLDRAAEEAERRIGANEYHPDADVRKELDRLLAEAEEKLG